MLQGCLLVCLLALLLAATYSPAWTFFGVHPLTPLLLAGYAYGIRLVRRSRQSPMWFPQKTRETRTDQPEESNRQRSLAVLLCAFAVLGGIMALAGWYMQHLASSFIAATGVTAAIVGTLFTSLATSLPELVTTIAAVRRGALTLACSGILGGNAFDTLFAAFSDLAYQEGSIYHATDRILLFWLAVSILMTGVLLMGMLVREKRGIANIGFESALILLIYGAAVTVLLIERL